MTVRLTPVDVAVEPGQSTTLELSITNTGSIVEQYDLEVVGPLARYLSASPARLNIFPGTADRALITVTIPQYGGPVAEAAPIGVKVTPSQFPDEVFVPEVTVDVLPYDEVVVELAPRTITGRGRAAARLSIDNRGNRALTMRIEPVEEVEGVQSVATPNSIQLGPASTATVGVEISTQDPQWNQMSRSLAFAFDVVPVAGDPIRVDGIFVTQPPPPPPPAPPLTPTQVMPTLPPRPPPPPPRRRSGCGCAVAVLALLAILGGGGAAAYYLYGDQINLNWRPGTDNPPVEPPPDAATDQPPAESPAASTSSAVEPTTTAAAACPSKVDKPFTANELPDGQDAAGDPVALEGPTISAENGFDRVTWPILAGGTPGWNVEFDSSGTHLLVDISNIDPGGFDGL